MDKKTIGAFVALLFLATPARPDSGPDAVLEDLLRRAAASSPALARARASAAVGRAEVEVARSPYRPVLGAEERFTSTNNAPTAFALTLDQGRFTSDLIDGINDPSSVTDFATSLYARYLLYDFGGRHARLEASRAEAERLGLLEQAAAREVRYRVTDAYYALLRARAAVAIRQDTVRLFEAHLALAHARYEAGAVLRSDVLTIEVRLAEARENLIAARNAASIALIALAAEVGEPLTEADVPERALGEPQYDLDEAVIAERALSTHPDLAAIDAGWRAAGHAEEAAASLNRPSIRGEVRGLWHGDDQAFGLERDSYQAFIVLDVPFWDGGRAGAEKAAAAARRETLEASGRELARALDLAARTAHREARESVERIAIADHAVVAAEASIAIIEERYGAGLSTIVDLIEAQRGVTEARVRALEARARAWRACAGVARIAGEVEP